MSDIVQGSAEWHAARLGKVTASRVADVVARTKTGWGASRANYAAQLVAERLTGAAAESFTNAAMQWGTDNEANARAAYAFLTGLNVEEVGFVPHPKIIMSGASPDGLVGADGLVEIKCPNTATHIETLLGATIPAKYETQMLWQMACTGRAWCDFVSFDPRMPADMQVFIKRLHRDEGRILELEIQVVAFLDEVEAIISSLLKTYREAA
jgi:putative phage-type endonuclease